MRLLVVEDDQRISNFLIKGLRENAYAVDAAANSEEALYQLSVNSYDAVILDVMLPGKSGFEICSDIRASGLNIPL